METKTQSDIDRVKAAKKRYSALLTDIVPWKKNWVILAKYFSPRKYRSLEDGDQTNEPTLADDLVDNESVRAMRILGAGLQGGMTSPARPWFRLGVPDPKLEENNAVKEWLNDVQRVMLSVMSRSNFYDSAHQLYTELGTFGVACMFVLDDPETIVRYTTLTAGEYMFITDAHNRVNGVFRTIDMSAENIVRRFGKENVSQSITSANDSESTKGTMFAVVHVVWVNPDRDKARLDNQAMEFESLYYELKADDQQAPLERSGYREQPFSGPRWDTVGSDTYGRGAAEDTLNDVRQLQSMVRSMLKALHKQVDPPMNAPASLSHVSTVPGAVNIVDSAGMEGLKPTYQVKPDVQNTMIAIAASKEAIRQGLYNDLFMMLAASQGTDKTATEVKALVEEKLIMLGPVVERLHNEFLDVVIDRTFAVCMRAGILPDPPPELDGIELKVEYISLLAQAQKLVGTSSIEQWMGLIGQYSELWPEMLDIPDTDEVATHYADLLNVPAKLRKSKAEREEIRAARAEQQQQAQQAEALAGAAGTVKDLSAAVPAGAQGDALGALTGGLVQ